MKSHTISDWSIDWYMEGGKERWQNNDCECEHE
jgi:hypothetical protein